VHAIMAVGFDHNRKSRKGQRSLGRSLSRTRGALDGEIRNMEAHLRVCLENPGNRPVDIDEGGIRGHRDNRTVTPVRIGYRIGICGRENT
jgi:hypothetical protein